MFYYHIFIIQECFTVCYREQYSCTSVTENSIPVLLDIFTATSIFWFALSGLSELFTEYLRNEIFCVKDSSL